MIVTAMTAARYRLPVIRKTDVLARTVEVSRWRYLLALPAMAFDKIRPDTAMADWSAGWSAHERYHDKVQYDAGYRAGWVAHTDQVAQSLQEFGVKID